MFVLQIFSELLACGFIFLIVSFDEKFLTLTKPNGLFSLLRFVLFMFPILRF